MSTEQELNEGQELVEVPEAPIDLFDAFSDPIAELEEKNPRVKFDITTYEGETECKKYIAQIGQLRIGVEALRKTLKKEFLDKGRAVDKDAKKKQDRIAAIDAVHSVPLKELENKRIAEVLEAREKEQAELKAVEDKRLADLEAREKEVKDALAEIAEAELAKKTETDILDAVAKAAVDSEAKLKVDVADAVAEVERKAKADAAVLAKEIADKYAAEQAEQREIDAGILARQQDVEHRRDYNSRASQALFIMIGNEEVSEAIVKAIVKGEVPNVTMNY